MNDATGSLDSLRREIDNVDDALHDLLMRRAALVADIGTVKSDGNTAVYRPGREARLLRRLLARNAGALPDRALARIWREIIAAATQIQGGLTVAYCPVGDAATGDRLARRHFGADTPMQALSLPSQVVTAVTGGEAKVGVLPAPRQDDAAPWWPLLRGRTGVAASAAHVVSCLPFVRDEPDAPPAAFVIALGEPEPSGDDRSLIVFECDEPLSRGRVREVLADNGLDPHSSVLCDDPERAGVQLHLVDIAGNVRADDRRLAGAAQVLSAAAVSRIGVYASPVSVGG